MESRHSIESLEGMGSMSHDLGEESRMNSFTIKLDTFSNEEKVAVVVPVTSVEEICFDAMVALSFLNFVGKVYDRNNGKVSTWVNGWQYVRSMSI